MKKTALNLLISSAMLATAATSAQAFDDIVAPKGNIAYVVDSQNRIVRDSWGGCVRTRDWSKKTAIAKCEGWPEPKVEPKVIVVKEVVPVKPVAAVVVPDEKEPEQPKEEVVVVEPVAPPVVIVEEAPAAFSGLFETNSFDLKPEAKEKLDAYADYMKRHPEDSIIITGYTDDRGAAAYNQKLSQKRANAVKKYLEEKGISGDRITAEGKGEANPVADNSTPEGRQKNRRVELNVVK